MRLLWTLCKVMLGLVLIIPVCIIVLATALGLFGALLGLAILAVKLAVVGLIAYGAFRLLTALFRGPAAPSERPRISDAPKVDPYHEAAMRELDRELGHVR